MASVFKRGGKANRHGYWYVSWNEWDGGRERRRTKCTHTTDKATAERIANKYEAEAALRREGVIDAAMDGICKESQRTVESHLVDYEAKLKAGDRTKQYVKQTIKYIRSVVKAGRFVSVADIEPTAVVAHAVSLKELNKSARTIQATLTAAKGFTKWLTANHKLPRDPLTSVRKPNPEGDRRRERRMLLPNEWRWVESVLSTPTERYRMSAQERWMLYSTAIQTGFRSKELRSLSRGRLYLNSDEPYITCKARSTKNERDARQFISPELALNLKSHVASKAPKAPVFGLPDESKVARMFREDVAIARAKWLKDAKDPDDRIDREASDFLLPENHDGEMLDFHSLRHTCGAWLAMAGEHPKVVQQVMRHSTISLTMDTYGHLFPGQEAEAVKRFTLFMGSPPESLAATGTCDEAPERSARRSKRDATRCMSSATPCDETTEFHVATLPINAGNSAARCEALPSSTMLCCPDAPLAQLAEQLTLNQ